MNPDLNAAQRTLADKAERLFGNPADEQARRRALSEPMFQPPSLWKTLAAEGLLGINIPAALGGSAASAHDAALGTHLVMQAIGRHLAPEPFMSSAVASTGLIVEAAEESLRNLMLPALIQGRVRLTLSALEADAPTRFTQVATRAVRKTHSWMLDGRKIGILDAPDTQWMILSARTSGGINDEAGISLFLVSRTARGVQMEYGRGPDGSEIASTTLRGVEVATNDMIGTLDQGYAPLERAVQRGMAALCSEAAGAMEKLLTLCDNHADTRKLAEAIQSAALLAAAATCNPDGAERRRAIANARATVSTAVRNMVSVTALQPGDTGASTGLTAEHFVRRLNVIAATWAPAG